ncbi:DUF4012 domain-containing protein [Candidatus Collierbacteria bacterium]|nr:DUF4012 domain-containing protein [Candidatus Collierbacteria bacterium]
MVYSNHRRLIVGLSAGILIIFVFLNSLFFKLLVNSPQVFGLYQPKKVLVLLQNNRELRPTGGFMGSYTTFTFDKFKIKDFRTYDIYDADGHVSNYITPPEAIQTAFQLGSWRLRDANWSPDFPQSAKTILWFFEQAGIENPDIFAAVNLSAVEKVFKILSHDLYLSDYNLNVSVETLWDITQQRSQADFFPGSKQKKEFIYDLSKELINEFGKLSVFQKIKLLNTLTGLFKIKDIQIYSANSRIQKTFTDLEWDGSLKKPLCPSLIPFCTPERIEIVEANLGSNKSNCCVTRKVKLEVEENGQTINHKLKITFSNQDNDQNKKWGGRYLANVRLFVNDEEMKKWVNILPGSEQTIDFDYQLNAGNSFFSTLFLTIQKQSGVDKLPIDIFFKNGLVNGQRHFEITSDKNLWLL